MLFRSLLNKLQEFIPGDAPEDIAAVIYSICGDLAYPQSIHIFGGCKNPADGSAQAHWNSQMSKEHEQSHQQDFCICQKYELTEDKLGHHIVNILQLQYTQVHHLA